MTVPYSNSRLS